MASVLTAIGLGIAGCGDEFLPADQALPFPDAGAATADVGRTTTHPVPRLPGEEDVLQPAYADISNPRAMDVPTSDLAERTPIDIVASDIPLTATKDTPQEPDLLGPDIIPWADDIPATDSSEETAVADTAVATDSGPDTIPSNTGLDVPVIPPCKPDLCEGFLDLSLKGPNAGEAKCIVLQTTDVGLTAPGPNVSLEVVDFNNDKWPDLALLDEGGQVVLWRNVSGTYKKAQVIPLAKTDTPPRMAWGGFFGDNWPDLIVSNGTKVWGHQNVDGDLKVLPDPIYQNDSNPATAVAALGSHVLVGTEQGILVYQNLVDGKFQEVSAAAGVFDGDSIVGYAVADFDLKGLPGFYAYKSIGKNRLCRQQSALSFVCDEDDSVAGTGNSTHAIGTSYNGGKYPSLFVPNYYGANSLYANVGGTLGKDVAASLGLASPEQVVFAAAGDFLGAGRPSYFLARWDLANLLMRPKLADDGTIMTYENYGYALGVSKVAQTRAAAWLDFDQDPDQQLDLLVLYYQGIEMFLNQSHWVQTCL